MKQTGTLANDSPVLNKELRRSFSKEEYAALAELFSGVAARGAYAEATLRKPGMSFNPRPARIALLALQEGKISTARGICAALIACTEDPQKLREKFPAECALAEEALKYPSASSAPGDPACAERIALALALDGVRHAHLLPSAQLRDKVLARAKELLTADSISSSEAQRLRAMLEHALKQQTTLACENNR